ncbi:MAG: T9SS type A sorting domain-containing protein [Bacteroidetes bacterium]|nr:MAG: T9SS type A sorting domain-containing protein [Bacteroidota bacterium]
MSKAFQLTIPKPCHEDWNKMTPDEKGRFCSSCQKQVVDFTSMNNQQLAAFFKKPSTGSVCGRFNNDQLNQDLQVPQKRIPWLKYFFTIVVPTFFAVTKAKAQGEVTKAVKGQTTVKIVSDRKGIDSIATTKCIPVGKRINGEVLPLINDTIVGDTVYTIIEENKTITGKVTDEKGESLVFVTIMVKGTQIRTQTDTSGKFKITMKEGNKLVVSYIGYETKELTPVNDANNLLITMVPIDEIFMGIIITKPVLKQKPIPLIPQISDTAFKNFKFYPNPAAQNTIITLEWNKPEAGKFEIQLINQQGQVVNHKTENFTEKLNSIQYPIPSVSPGSYFLVIINRKSGKKLTEKIIIQ